MTSADRPWTPKSITRSILDRFLRPNQAASNARVAADELSAAVGERREVDREVVQDADDSDHSHGR